MGAAVLIPAAATVVSGMMQGKGGKSGPAKLAPGLGSLPGLVQGLGQAGASGMGGSLGGFQGGKGNDATNSLIGQVGSGTGTVGGAFNQGVGDLRTGSSTGFLPDVMSAVEGQMLPGLERAFGRGAGALQEQAALTGNQTSSGAFRDIADFRGGLEAQMGQQLASIYGSAVPAAIGARGASSQALAGLPGALQQGLTGPQADREISSSQFDRGLPLQALATAFQGAGSLPYSAQGGKGGGKGGGGKGGQGSGLSKLNNATAVLRPGGK